MTFTAADRTIKQGRRAPSHGSPSSRGSIWLSRKFALLLLGSALVLWGCGSPGSPSVQVQHQGRLTHRAPAASAPSQLRLLTYNIWGLPAWINGANPARYPKIARELEQHAPHFILLQEVWSANAHEAAPAGDGWWTASSSARGLFFRRNGLVSLSRYPIVGSAFRPFRAGALPDSLVSKGALKITVEISPSLRVNVWNVHLQAGPAAQVRTRQILELADWVQQAEDRQVADLIAGDFNCTPDSEQYAQLTMLLGVDATQLETQSHFVTFDGCHSATTEARTLDYVFVRLREASIVCDVTVAPAMDNDRPEDRLSDHLAVKANFRFGFTALTAQSPAYDLPLAQRAPLP